MINHVLKATQNDTLRFVGHSMGTTAFFAMLSETPAMNAKIGRAVMLAPVTQAKNMYGLPKYSANFLYVALKLVNK